MQTPRSYGPIAQPTQYFDDLGNPGVSFTPSSASSGSDVFIYFRSAYDLASPSFRFYVLFNEIRCEATARRLDNADDHDQYAVIARIPNLQDTADTDSFALNLDVADTSGRTYGIFRVGVFFLESAAYRQAFSPSPSEQSRKRRASNESVATPPEPVKRPSVQHLRVRARGQSSGSSPSMVAVPQEPSQQQILPMTGKFEYAPVTSATPLSTAQGPRQSSRSGFMARGVDNARSQGMQSSFYAPASASSLPARSRAHRAGSPSVKPSLIRTSTLYPTQISGAGVDPPNQPFDSYSVYPAQAMLVIEGDLDLMGIEWSFEEKDARRKLVEFERKQTNSIITTAFKTVALEDRAPNSICVSCIWWEEKQEAFITSVDTIYLLESLVSVRFTVEEKNRIRRNLEGFRPLTVSKGKADSEEFFKIIMGFGNPKPRNIEKDVKVFPWKILTIALKKIISKYSASPSSTAGSLQPQGGRTFDRRASPSSTSSSVASVPQASGGGAIAFSPPSHTTDLSRSLSRSIGPPELMPSTLTQQYPPTYGPYQGAWQRDQQPSELPAYAMTGSWGLGQYLEPTPTAALPSEYQFDPHAQMQTHPGSQYTQADDTYHPYQQNVSHP
ncbi:MAG: hypothetical protein M1828_000531 [Chrysothrix sp. TS-e1954]|nr:MAG: hypothetical protein M1828_000531 [Chrysothrix sp. TS-e1954]